MSLTLLAIEAPDYGLSDVESLALVAAIFLALAAIVIGLFVGGQYASVKDKLDEIDDRTTLPFAEVEEFAEDEPDPDEIEVVPPTEPSGMPLALESAKLEAERDPVDVEYREFTRADGSVARFQVRSPQ